MIAGEFIFAASGGQFRLHHLPAALLPLLILVVALDAYCLVDLVRAKSVRGVPKVVWALAILFVSPPIGALVYLFLGRDRAGGRPDGLSLRGEQGPAPRQTQPDPGWDGNRSHTGAGGPPAARVPIVTTSGLTRDYGGTGLFDVDLKVPQGSIYGLVGPNGAGKTTLLSLLSGLRRPDRGEVSVSVGRNRIAVCPDVPEFDGWLTASEVVDLARSLVTSAAGGQHVAVPGENVAAGGQGVAVPGRDVVAALRTVGLADCAGRRVDGFSRGMVQRLGLACALVGDPHLLILDEPTSALDPAGRAEILGLVAAMRGRRTVIFSSHILADVQRIADHVGILRDGRLIYQGATADLIDTYLKPRWTLRVADDATPVAAALTAQEWAVRVEPVGVGSIRIEATSIEAGERGIPAIIAACGARQVSCEPADADLESAFLALTSAGSGVSAGA